MQIIDEMWHSFILFTDSYHEFCEKNFGAYLHHFPFTRGMLREEIKYVSKKNSSFQREKEEGYMRQIDLIEQLFGPETVVKWYLDYADKYGVDSLNLMRKPLDGTNSNTDNIDRNSPYSILIGAIKNLQSIGGCACSGKGCGAGCSCNSR